MTFLHHSSAMFVHWSKFQKRVVCLLVLSSIGTKKRKLDMSAVMSGYKFPTLAWEEGGGGGAHHFDVNFAGYNGVQLSLNGTWRYSKIRFLSSR